MTKTLKVLGIESSCDETGVALVAVRVVYLQLLDFWLVMALR